MQKNSNEGYLPVEQAAELFSTTPGYLNKLRSMGRIKSKKDKNSKGKGRPRRVLKLESLIEYFGEPGTGMRRESTNITGKPKIIIESIPKEEVVEEKIVEVTVDLDQTSRSQADLLHKREQVRKLKLENDIKQGHLVDVKEVSESLELLMKLFVDNLRDFIDGFAIKFQFDGKQIKAIQDDFNRKLEAAKRSVEALV